MATPPLKHDPLAHPQGLNVLPAERRAALLAQLELGVLLDEQGDLAQHVKLLRSRVDEARRDAEAAQRQLEAAKSHSPVAERPHLRAMAAELAVQTVQTLEDVRHSLQQAHGRLENFSGQEIGRAQRHQLAAELLETLQEHTALEDRLREDARAAQDAVGGPRDAQEATKRHTGVVPPGALPLGEEPDGAAVEVGGERQAQLQPVLDAVDKLVQRHMGRAPGAAVPREDLAPVQHVWADQLAGEARLAAMGDPNEMAQWVMRRAYEDNTQDMRRYAMRTQFHTALRNQVRTEAQRARQFLSDHISQHGSDAPFDTPFDAIQLRKEPEIAEDGSWQLRPAGRAAPIRDAKALERYIADMEQLGLAVGDDMQVVQIELQSAMQRQQQVMNALSSVSKAMHEIAMSILRKIGT